MAKILDKIKIIAPPLATLMMSRLCNGQRLKPAHMPTQWTSPTLRPRRKEKEKEKRFVIMKRGKI